MNPTLEVIAMQARELAKQAGQIRDQLIQHRAPLTVHDRVADIHLDVAIGICHGLESLAHDLRARAACAAERVLPVCANGKPVGGAA